MSKRPSLRAAVQWIAENDNPGDQIEAEDLTILQEYVSVLLVADLFNKSPEQVARAVIKTRKKRSDK